MRQILLLGPLLGARLVAIKDTLRTTCRGKIDQDAFLLQPQREFLEELVVWIYGGDFCGYG